MCIDSGKKMEYQSPLKSLQEVPVTGCLKEVAQDGKELLFDHGAPYFTVSNLKVLGLVHEWEPIGLVALWNEKLESFDCDSKKFLNTVERIVPDVALKFKRDSCYFMLCSHDSI